MRLLVVNGNTNEGMTRTLDAAARRMVPDGVEVVTYQVRGGPRYIGSRDTYAEAVPHIVARFRELTNGHGPWDAGVLACFGEPGLGDVRRACDFPVVGMAESSAHMAVQLCDSFGVVTPGENWPSMLRAYFDTLGVLPQCAGIEVVRGEIRTLDEDEGVAIRVSEAIKRLRTWSKPGVVIVGGAALAGVAEHIRTAEPPILVDSFRAAVCQSIALASVSWRS
ncbi:MAG: aspartate/glutamate racemase family protein [Geminicoccaceae bacterium]|jgi:Asp/Glu/hydantoin racemase